MSIASQTFNTPGTHTFVAPTTMISNSLSVTVRGGRGTYGSYNGLSLSGPGGQVTAQIDTSGLGTPATLTCIVGSDASGTNGGAGFSGGGGSGGWKFGNRAPWQGGAGGGSSAILTVGNVLLIEGGGGDGVGWTFHTGSRTPSGYPAGKGGGQASNTPGNGTCAGEGAGSGGANGGSGGNGAAGTGGTGHGGGTPGNSNSGQTSGAGVGSGGFPTTNCGAGFAAPAPQVQNAVPSVGPGGPGLVTLSYHTADAPSAPILRAPSNGVFIDTNGQGVTFQGTYQAPSGDTGVLFGVALRVVISGVNHWWNGTDFSSTTPIFRPPDTGVAALNNENFTVVIPPGVLSDAGSPVYSWSMACSESLFNLQGPYAANLSFTAVVPPTATITSPTGTISTTTPTISWTNTTPGGTQQSYRYLIYDTAQVMGVAGAAVPGGAIYDSGVVASASTSFTLPGGLLHSVNDYFGYLMIVNSAGSIPSLWASDPFTVAIQSANTVTLTATSSTDPVTGMPAPQLVMHMTGADALSFAWFQGDYGNGFEDIVAGLQPISGGAATVYDLGAPFNVAISYRVRAAGVITGNQEVTAWSTTATMAAPGVQSKNWWVVVPTALGTSVQISRLPATASSSSSSGQTITQPPMPGTGLTASLAVEEWEQQGVFRGFGRSNAVVVHGDIWNPEFDLAVYFLDPASFNSFSDIRETQEVVLLKSDMEGSIYWVTFGPDFNPGIVRETQRHKAPKRSLVVHCTPTDRYFPPNPFVPST